MTRRGFIAGLASTLAWPLVEAEGQPAPTTRRIGVLTGSAADDPIFRGWFSAFSEALRELGWVEGRNIHIEQRAAGGDLIRLREHALELVSFRPDVLVSNPTPATTALRQSTQDIPIVFVNVADPLGSGFVDSLARPGRNITGFMNFEPAMGSKWLELLKELAPQVQRVGMLFNPDTAASGATGGVYLNSIEAATRRIGVRLVAMPVHDPDDIDAGIASLAQQPNSGMLVMPNLFILNNRHRIIARAAEHRLPAVYPQVYLATAGGLAAYSVDVTYLFYRAASYVDRILRGTRVNDLPVQAPTKFQLVINLKTANALGLTISPTLLARADEVIE